MCTVTFIPTEAGCLITSNRDEIITRALAEPPAVFEIEQSKIILPRDPVGGGTWIASGKKATVCLFNGAFEKHKHQPPYRISRGQVPMAYFEHKHPEDFVTSYDFEGIEPFSIVVYQDGRLSEIKWDEQNPHLIEHDPSQAHIWASVTLYDEKIRSERKQWFDEWLATDPKRNVDAIMRFHTSDLGDRYNGLLIDRPNGLKTVSVTSVRRNNEEGSFMRYLDRVQKQESQLEFGH